MSGDLVQLAQRYVNLNGELNEVRDAMKRLLLNGGGGEQPEVPFSQPARLPGGSKPKPSVRSGAQHPKVIAAAKMDEKIISLLKDQPGMKVVELAKATGSKTSTTSERLHRMKERQLIVPAEGGGWAASAPA